MEYYFLVANGKHKLRSFQMFFVLLKTKLLGDFLFDVHKDCYVMFDP